MRVPGARRACLQDDQMLPMREMVERPGLVRRVACHALLEDERSERWIEPMVYVHADDQEEVPSPTPPRTVLCLGTARTAVLPHAA